MCEGASLSKYKCPTCDNGVIIPISKESCKCSNGCTFKGNTKELISLNVISQYLDGEKIYENLPN